MGKSKMKAEKREKGRREDPKRGERGIGENRPKAGRKE